MAKSLIETMEEENKVARAKAEQVQQVKEAVQERTETTKTLIEYQKAVAEQNKTLQENQQTLYNAINDVKESFESFESKADTLTQENIQALNKAVDTLKNILSSIDSKIAEQIKNNFDSQVATLKNSVSQNTKALTDTTTKAQEIIKNGYDNFNVLLNEEKKELQQQVKSISSKFSFLFIIIPILLIIPTLYCLQWQFNFIPFLNKAPITDMFIMGFVCAIALIILLVIIAKIISAKLQN